MMERVIINRTVESCMAISRNGYGNAIIGRYGGCFEEGHGGCMVLVKVERHKRC